MCTAGASTLLPAETTLDENLDDDSAWEDEADVEPPSHSGPSEEPPAHTGPEAAVYWSLLHDISEKSRLTEGKVQ